MSEVAHKHRVLLEPDDPCTGPSYGPAPALSHPEGCNGLTKLDEIQTRHSYVASVSLYVAGKSLLCGRNVGELSLMSGTNVSDGNLKH